MSKAEILKKKKDLGKPYSSSSKKKLNSKQDIDSPLVTELERLLTETMNTMSLQPNAEWEKGKNESPQLPVLPKCSIDKSELIPYTAKKTGERFFKCHRAGCGVICCEKNLLDYCGAVLEKLHNAFKWSAPVCGCGDFMLLNVSKSDRNFMVPYYSCAQRNKEDRSKFFHWGNEPLSNKNLQISNEVMKQCEQRVRKI